MKMFSICGFAMLCLVHVSMVSSLVTNHTCAYFNTTPKNPFDKTLYAGQWYMHQLYDWGDASLGSANYDCYVQIRTPRTDGNLDLSEILVNPGLQPRIQMDGKLTFDQSGMGRYTYSAEGISFTSVLDILATDYETYTIEWNCFDLPGGGSVSTVFITSRFPVVLRFTQIKIDNVLDKYRIDKTKLRTASITSCPADLLKKGGGGGLLGVVGGLLGGVGGLVGGLLGGVGGLLGGLLGLVTNLLGAILKALLG